MSMKGRSREWANTYGTLRRQSYLIEADLRTFYDPSDRGGPASWLPPGLTRQWRAALSASPSETRSAVMRGDHAPPCDPALLESASSRRVRIVQGTEAELRDISSEIAELDRQIRDVAATVVPSAPACQRTPTVSLPSRPSSGARAPARPSRQPLRPRPAPNAADDPIRFVRRYLAKPPPVPKKTVAPPSRPASGHPPAASDPHQAASQPTRIPGLGDLWSAPEGTSVSGPRAAVPCGCTDLGAVGFFSALDGAPPESPGRSSGSSPGRTCEGGSRAAYRESVRSAVRSMVAALDDA